jgi:peptide/nickel transport system ATP-binding protein
MSAVLEINQLRTIFPSRSGGALVRACDGVDLQVNRGEIVGLVGESGCGKSTLGRTIVGLEKITDGSVYLEGTDLSSLKGSALRIRRRKIQYIFQDPYASLSPRQTIGEALTEALKICGVRDRAARDSRIAELLEQVELSAGIAARYPRELSGGQRQRVAIARALVVEPEVLICDEPVSSLDISIRAQIMNLFLKLQHERGLACLFISHDLSIVRQAAQRIYVMYLGKIVETGESDEIYGRPLHPYTQSLLNAIPSPDPRVERQRRRVILQGDLPSPANPPRGCRFRTRCPVAVAECAERSPLLVGVDGPHLAACHFAGKVNIVGNAVGRMFGDRAVQP